MHTLMNCYHELKQGAHLDQVKLSYLRSEDVKSFQLASLVVRLLHRGDLDQHEYELVQYVFERHPKIAGYTQMCARQTWRLPICSREVEVEIDPALEHLLRHTSREQILGEQSVRALVARFSADQICIDFMAMWLMLVCCRGLSPEDTLTLTLAMRDSGNVYDYRSRQELGFKKIIRRYPTGALSEKISLILPSLLASVRDEYPLATPFLVGRSLSFTGGTWDKFKAIPGFSFPAPGDDSIRAMQHCGVAMSVTHDDIDPADRKMYQLRSSTGTVESHELIIASIGSKHLALPADHLLMDVRYGEGAFLRDRAEAERLAIELCAVMEGGGVPTSFKLIDTPQPNGAAIGNAMEVLEAIAIMRGDSARIWDPRALSEQRALVLEFFALLMSRSFGGGAKEPDWKAIGNRMFDSGELFHWFLRLLEAHGVDEQTREAVASDPARVIGPQVEPIHVRARVDGVLQRIDQQRLGNLINFRMGGGGNEFAGHFEPNSGIILAKRLQDPVHAGDVICTVYSSLWNDHLQSELLDYFEIG